ncbi:MAG: hypothetical protein LC792_13270 [Actinobacteria bacterium]|nr:hypothetical protein [Actinomycetota bacterium]
MTFDPASSAPPPSAEVLGNLARRVADAYPGLYTHQRSGVAFLLSRRRAILADDMGLGKTRQAIVAVREAAPGGPYLVICPAGVRLNWRREIHLVEPDGDVLVVTGAAAWDALTGEAPREPPTRASPPTTMGLLEETLDLLARTTIASPLADPDAGERRITVPSRSQPGRTYTVVIAGGVVRCDCPGFSYRGNCTHAREAIG